MEATRRSRRLVEAQQRAHASTADLLDVDALSCILGAIDDARSLVRAACTCRLWRAVALSREMDGAWIRLCAAVWPALAEPPPSWARVRSVRQLVYGIQSPLPPFRVPYGHASDIVYMAELRLRSAERGLMVFQSRFSASAWERPPPRPSLRFDLSMCGASTLLPSGRQVFGVAFSPNCQLVGSSAWLSSANGEGAKRRAAQPPPSVGPVTLRLTLDAVRPVDGRAVRLADACARPARAFNGSVRCEWQTPLLHRRGFEMEAELEAPRDYLHFPVHVARTLVVHFNCAARRETIVDQLSGFDLAMLVERALHADGGGAGAGGAAAAAAAEGGAVAAAAGGGGRAASASGRGADYAALRTMARLWPNLTELAPLGTHGTHASSGAAYARLLAHVRAPAPPRPLPSLSGELHCLLRISAIDRATAASSGQPAYFTWRLDAEGSGRLPAGADRALLVWRAARHGALRPLLADAAAHAYGGPWRAPTPILDVRLDLLLLPHGTLVRAFDGTLRLDESAEGLDPLGSRRVTLSSCFAHSGALGHAGLRDVNVDVTVRVVEYHAHGEWLHEDDATTDDPDADDDEDDEAEDDGSEEWAGSWEAEEEGEEESEHAPPSEVEPSTEAGGQGAEVEAAAAELGAAIAPLMGMQAQVQAAILAQQGAQQGAEQGAQQGGAPPVAGSSPSSPRAAALPPAGAHVLEVGVDFTSNCMPTDRIRGVRLDLLKHALAAAAHDASPAAARFTPRSSKRECKGRGRGSATPAASRRRGASPGRAADERRRRVADTHGELSSHGGARAAAS